MLTNWLIVLGIFLPVAVFDNGAADAVAIALLFYLYFFILEKRPIRLDCPHCKRIILSNTPWVCKACTSKNTDTDNYSFLNKCNNCGVEPKAYRCHHKGCGEIIFFTGDQDETNYASGLNSPAEVPKPDERTEKVKAKVETVEDKKKDIEIAELDEKLKTIKERVEGPKIKTPFEQKKESFEKYYDGVMGIREHARKKRAEAAETYKDDPESLKDANDAIDEFLKRSA